MRTFTVSAIAVGLLAAAVLCGCSALPRPAAQAARPRTQRAVIGVLLAGWHTGLILPVNELGPLRAVLPDYPGAHYVSFGWGNRRFYISADPTVWDALSALFSSPSTLLVAAAPTAAALLPADGTYRWLCADRPELRRLDAYLLATLRRRAGRPIGIVEGPWPDSEFFASGERYDALHTCNTWTAEALHAAGLKIADGAVIFAFQLRDRLRALRTCQRRDMAATGSTRTLPDTTTAAVRRHGASAR